MNSDFTNDGLKKMLLKTHSNKILYPVYKSMELLADREVKNRGDKRDLP